MGVSGCGKSLIGAGLARATQGRFVDGDTLHPDANIAKMSRGEPLDDADRWPWLDRVGAALAEGLLPAFVACSALKRVYRTRIVGAAGHPVTFLYLRTSRATLARRMTARPGHFMPPALLDSQLATLEEPGADEPAVTVDTETSPETVIAALLAAVHRTGAGPGGG